MSEFEFNKNDYDFSLLALSDVHVSSLHMNQTADVRDAFSGINFSFDALAFAGDLTDNGLENEYAYLKELIKKSPFEGEIIPASGNHDVRLGSVRLSEERFNAFLKEVNPAVLPTGRLYYTHEVRGCEFFVLGSVKRRLEEAVISEYELKLLETFLQKNKNKNRPAFIILHQPLKKTHNLPLSWDSPGTLRGSVGAQSEKIKNLLKESKNFILLTGHLHRGFNSFTFEKIGGGLSLSVPALGLYNKDSENPSAGQAVYMTLLRDELSFYTLSLIGGKIINKTVFNLREGNIS